jgi:hypothetical protein
MARKPRERQPMQIPISGELAHNSGFYTAIGGMVVHWANTESIFMAILQVLLSQDKFSAAIVWHSLRATNSRLEMIDKLAKERVKDEALLSDLQACVSKFKGFCRTRNFFCHATYSYDAVGNLDFAQGIRLTNEDDPLGFERRGMDRSTANQIIDAVTKLPPFSDECWDVAERLDQAFGTQLVERPQRTPSR